MMRNLKSKIFQNGKGIFRFFIFYLVVHFEIIEANTVDQETIAEDKNDAAFPRIRRSTAESEHCKSLKAKKGEITGDQKRLTKTKTDNLKDSGLPKAVLADIQEIIDGFSKTSKSSEPVEIKMETEGDMQDEDIPTPTEGPLFSKEILVNSDNGKKLWSDPDCLPSLNPKSSSFEPPPTDETTYGDRGLPSENSPSPPGGKIPGVMPVSNGSLLGRRQKRSPKKKNNCRIVWVWPSSNKHKKPSCEDFLKKHGSTPPKQPDTSKSKNNDKYKVEIWKDENGDILFKATVEENTREGGKSKVDDSQKGDTILIKPQKKTSGKENSYVYLIFKESPVKPEDEEDMKEMEELNKLRDLHPIVTILWKKNGDHYCLTDVILRPIESLESLCEGIPHYLDYQRTIKDGAKDQKTSTLILESGSSPAKKLFGKGAHFSLASWYQLYRDIIIPDNFKGENFVVTETITEESTGRVQVVTIIWDEEIGNKGKIDLKLNYIKVGDPEISMQLFKLNGQTQERCPIKIKRLLFPHKGSQHLEEIGELNPNPTGRENVIESSAYEEHHSNFTESNNDSESSSQNATTVTQEDENEEVSRSLGGTGSRAPGVHSQLGIDRSMGGDKKQKKRRKKKKKKGEKSSRKSRGRSLQLNLKTNSNLGSVKGSALLRI
ncbi:unnamed protein product [Allacma fusca]|uniref:Uncharacterized protein n=1 Tax=Allacma fusca TaxID=39272 RepID=A0A8J2JFE6_9HEXA|nr:unnamed protein product [Allacma fusca]